MADDPIAAARKHVRRVKRTPEGLLTAARASLNEAEKLALPSSDPERGVEHDAKKHIARIEAALNKERVANRELREAVITYGRRMTILMRVGIVFGLAATTLGAVLLLQQRAFAERNREAVRVSCTLLTNAILESGGGGTGQPARTPAARAQRENTAILIAAINRELLTARERRTLVRNASIVAKAGGVLSTPDCDEVAKHPERVREIELGETKEPARRSPATRP